MIATRRLGYVAAAWAATYVPIHVYWALGGTSTPLGITGERPGFQAANWGASLVIAGAGLTCLSLTSPWGARLPVGLRRGLAWVGGVAGLVHWLLYTVASTLRLTGVVGYPADGGVTAAQLRRFDWVNVGYFELWFGVMGVLLLACVRRNRVLEPSERHGALAPGERHRRRPGATGVATALMLAGAATVLIGVFTFQPWVFAAWGPALLAGGALVAVSANRRRDSDEANSLP
jgi:hypothetical protein